MISRLLVRYPMRGGVGRGMGLGGGVPSVKQGIWEAWRGRR